MLPEAPKDYWQKDIEWAESLTDEDIELLLGSMTYQEWVEVMTPIWRAQLYGTENLPDKL